MSFILFTNTSKTAVTNFSKEWRKCQTICHAPTVKPTERNKGEEFYCSFNKCVFSALGTVIGHRAIVVVKTEKIPVLTDLTFFEKVRSGQIHKQ